MHIFEYYIANDYIKGITALDRTERHDKSEEQFSFHIITPFIPLKIDSPWFNPGDGNKTEWLLQYQTAKDRVARLLGERSETREDHLSAVEDCFTSLKASIDRALELLQPSGTTLNGTVNSWVERIHIESSKLKALAIK